jgi:protein TonB
MTVVAFEAAAPRREEEGLGHWAASLAIVVAFHVAAGSALLAWRNPVEPAAESLTAIELDLAPEPAPPLPAVELPPPDTPPPVDTAELMPEPPPPEPQPEIKRAPEPPVVAPEVALPPPPKPRPKMVQKPPPRPVEVPPQAAPAETAPAAPPPVAPAAVAPPRPAPSPDAMPSFQSLLLAHLQRHQRYPALARRRLEQGTPIVRFTMDTNGRVTALALQRGSGHDMLDEEALAMLRRAEPLPRIPAELGVDRLELDVPILFRLR